MEQVNGDKILVVEGETTARRHVRDYLTKVGYCVDDVDRVEQAVGLLRSRRYDAVVLDTAGDQTDERLQEILTVSQGTPVIVMSGEPSLKSIIASLRHGAFDYIIKPYEIADLSTIVPRAVRLGSTRRGVQEKAGGDGTERPVGQDLSPAAES